MLAMVMCLLALSALGCGAARSSSKHANSQSDFVGSVLTPRIQAPPLALRSYRGSEVRLSRFRGKVVLLTFLYTHCPDVCPLIAGNLRVVHEQIHNEASRVEMLAVSTDPRGDTPRIVKKFLKARGVTGQLDYLIGSQAELRPVWRRWHVGAMAGKHGLVGHSALVYGISASGKLVTIYPSNFRPTDIEHDIPRLAAL
jgi:protein SCO1/2